MAGYSISANDVNAKAGSLVTSLWDNLDQMNRFYKWLVDTTHNDTFLNNIGITGSSSTAGSDVKILRDSIADLGSTTSGLWAVAHNLKTVTSTNDFFFNAKNLTGTNFTG